MEEKEISAISKSVITVADYSGMDMDDENLTDSAISTDTGSDLKFT